MQQFKFKCFTNKEAPSEQHNNNNKSKNKDCKDFQQMKIYKIMYTNHERLTVGIVMFC